MTLEREKGNNSTITIRSSKHHIIKQCKAIDSTQRASDILRNPTRRYTGFGGIRQGPVSLQTHAYWLPGLGDIDPFDPRSGGPNWKLEKPLGDA